MAGFGALPAFRVSPLRSSEKARTLTAADLDLQALTDSEPEAPGEEASPGDLPESQVGDDDEVYKRVLTLLEGDFAGVIFVGPPGTSKSWYAENIGIKLADRDSSRFHLIQFHPSYQYEDFVEGYVPQKGGKGFRLAQKHLLRMCQVAEGLEGKKCVLVIDELSRADPARVFGEALTYVEKSRRGNEFFLASGRRASIPSNLVILATMNSLDRGVDEVDAALERRFAKIAMDPSPKKLQEFLLANGMAQPLLERVLRFFNRLQEDPFSKIGHTFFRTVRDEPSLRVLWENQLRFTLEKALRVNKEGFKSIERSWNAVFSPAGGGGATQPAAAPAAASAGSTATAGGQ